MQPAKIESLITPPWPSTQELPVEHQSSHTKRDLKSLSNFERNEKSEENLDHIAMLGYD